METKRKIKMIGISTLFIISGIAFGQNDIKTNNTLSVNSSYQHNDIDLEGKWRAEGQSKIILSGILNTNIELGNLSSEDLRGMIRTSKNGFKIERDAGIFFFDRKSSGRFYYRPKMEYFSKMNDLGFKLSAKEDKPSSSSFYLYAVHDLSYEYAMKLKDAGYEGILLNTLLKFRSTGVSVEYINAMADEGFKNLSPDDLILLSVQKIPTEYIRSLVRIGYKNLSMDDLIVLHVQKVPINFIKDVIGTSNSLPTAHELTLIWMHGNKSSKYKHLF
ncbi:MAG: hypothetical protein KKG99_16140 [Bacteroidetes bacterium]|nr:hypothetical protein [Bacteroidota bacterium]